MRPEKVNLVCAYCKHTWLEQTTTILSAQAVIYRNDEETVKRRLDCPNCGRGVEVKIPKGWVES